MLCAMMAVSGLHLHAFSQQYPFKLYSTRDGLVHTEVTRIRQDSRGDFWIGTSGGLSIYDGVSFSNLLDRDSSRSHVKDILELDSASWVATEGNGIAVISRDRMHTGWIRMKDGLLPSDSVYRLFRDSKRRTWIGTAAGLVVISPDGVRESVRLPGEASQEWVMNLEEFPDGSMMVGGQVGTFRCRYHAGRFNMVGLPVQRVRSLFRTEDGTILGGTSEAPSGRNGIAFRFWPSGKVDTLLDTRRAGGMLKVTSVIEDVRGTVWVASINGLFNLNGTKAVRVNRENGLPHTTSTALLEDRVGTLWVGTAGGLAKLPRNRFISYLGSPVSYGFMNVGLAASDGSMWFGGFGTLLRVDKEGHIRSIDNPHPSLPFHIFSITEDKLGTIWIGSNRGLLTYKNGAVIPPAIKGLPALERIGALCADPSGDLLVGTRGALYRVRESAVIRSYGAAAGIPDDLISTILVDSAGIPWFGTWEHGLGMIRDDKAMYFTLRDGLPSNWIIRLYAEQDSAILCLTARGFTRRVRERFEPLRRGDVSADLPVGFGRALDAQGHPWFFTAKGIYHWSDEVSALYDSRHGLSSDVVHDGVFDSRGNLWVATPDGIAVMAAASWNDSTPPTQTRITWEASNDNDRNSATVPHDRNFFSFQLSATDYIDEIQTEYTWRLSGTNEQWQTDIGPTIVNYPLLPPGQFELQARSRNLNGDWSDTARFLFTIDPPFWKRWWFITLLSLTGTALLWLLYRYRVEHFLAMERVRMRIASDLHDEIGSSLGGIALEGQLLLRKDHLNAPARETISDIVKASHETAEAMRDIVWLINPDNDSFAQLVAKMKEIGSRMLKGTTHSFISDQQQWPESVDLEFKRNVVLIYKEVLHNISKHSHATEVKSILEISGGRFRLCVQDDGRGFEPQSITQGHGLKSLRHRAGYVNGRLDIESSKGGGTKVTLEAKIP